MLRGKIAVDRDPSDTQFSLVTFHELFHAKAYQAGQIKTKEGNFGFDKYRNGFIVTSRDGKKTYFDGVEEAVVGHMTQRFFNEVLSKDPKFIPEIEERKKNGQPFDISRQDEQAAGKKIVEDLFIKNPGKFDSKEEIMEMFIKAQVTGNLLPVARLLEKTYGKGSFRKLGEETGTVERPDPKRLLLNPDQERKERRRRPPPPYVEEFPNSKEFPESDKKIIIFGSGHRDLASAKMMKERFEAEKPELVLFEGSGIEDLKQLEKDGLSDEEIITKYSEQTYVRYLAKKSGVEARSWDISLKEQVKLALRKGNNPDAIIGSFSFSLSGFIKKEDESTFAKDVIKALTKYFNEELVDEVKKEFGVDLTPSNFDLDEIARKYIGASFVKLTAEQLQEGAGSKQKNPLSQVGRDTGEARDLHAIDVITEAKEKYKKVFATAGSSHFLTWEPAIKEIYKP